MAKSQITDLSSTPDTGADTAADAVEAVEVPAGFQRVIVHRPADVTDSHLFVGHNSYEQWVPYNTPVNLPDGAVQMLREAVRQIPTPGPNGEMRLQRSPAYAVVPA